ncbi:histidine kinase [Malaciobacter molluscorum LMG 25693]|uniref:histidine kinase n=1 Tax=Malaciobacter molluscorum LMG 25693 TaxID=870501 RepID=A0A2G1DGE0_9BACT|nr:histidine kinase dimerization/phosphoacceptor domain -containing protein [Malaciobacter molluscorum]AXX91476.1 two-component system sensor histidine kinase [Malaciobacter molluscorum LMG 25693]PHO17562.1 histidine kinase [Malaciobacter molluscorum LMG 25693]
MSNVFRLKNYSFTTKVIFSFLFIIMIFLATRTVLTIPKVQEENQKQIINNITKNLGLIKKQFNIIGKSIKMQSDLEISLYKEKIVNEIKNIEFKYKNKKELIELIGKNRLINLCSYQINSNIKKIKEQDYFIYNDRYNFDIWKNKKIDKATSFYRKKIIFFYNHKFKNNIILSLSCTKKQLNLNHNSFEKSLKSNIYTNLLDDESLKSEKIAIFWLNPKALENRNEVLYSIKKDNYILSKLSNVKNIPTGKLTINELIKADEKSVILNKVNNKNVFTWVIKLSERKNRYIFLIYTVNKDEIDAMSDAGLSFLLKETLIAISISIFIILLFFRKALLNINTITKVAIKVNQGHKNIRSGVKGEDDIGNLGKAFDSMLDFFENSIKTLDIKVKEKTKKISESLQEKDILLKEIHHRVKNNLALTIGLIELQEEELKDIKTKKALVDIKERIFTMELLHRKLYESKNISFISLKNYVEDLVSVISRSYCNNFDSVDINLEVEDINLNIEKAMPYAIVLNELITNSFKYAFKDNKNPKLNIKISKNETTLTMIVKDNGKGLKDNFEKISDETLGLKLINTIVKFQLFGEIKYFYEDGAKFFITSTLENNT